MTIRFTGLPTADVTAIRASGRDAYDLPVERHISTGDAWPCRHCLQETPRGETYLILAHRPFQGGNAYTETGPIYLCAAECKAADPVAHVPPILRAPTYLARGYSADERIVGGTGQVVETDALADYAGALLSDPRIAFVDVRSAANNCFFCRVSRA